MRDFYADLQSTWTVDRSPGASLSPMGPKARYGTEASEWLPSLFKTPPVPALLFACDSLARPMDQSRCVDACCPRAGRTRSASGCQWGTKTFDRFVLNPLQFQWRNRNGAEDSTLCGTEFPDGRFKTGNRDRAKWATTAHHQSRMT
jgi:hypothetical protein